MRQIIFTFLSVLFVAEFAVAQPKVSPKKNRRPNQVDMEAIQLAVVYGDKTTLFTVSKTKGGGQVEMSSNGSAPSKKDISKVDYEFLKSKTLKISGISNSKDFCPRNYMTSRFEHREWLGCMGSNNTVAKNLQDTANLLSLLF